MKNREVSSQEMLEKLGREIAEYEPNHLDLREVLAAFRALSDWINEVVIPSVGQVSDSFRDVGLYVNAENKLAFDPKKNTPEFLHYWQNKEIKSVEHVTRETIYTRKEKK